MGNMAWHSAAEIFPMLGDADLAELARDIKENGLVEPIVTHEGCILDGRNRYRACEIAGVAPRFVAWDGSGGSPTLFAVSKNLHRRHLTLGQRAAIGVGLLPLLQAEAKKREATSGPGIYGGKPGVVSLPDPVSGHGRSYEIAAKAVQVGASSIARAAQVKAADPEAFERVKRGESTVNAEYRKVRDVRETPALPEPTRKLFGSKRQAINENAAKQRMITGLSTIEGICTGMKTLDMAYILSACSEEDLHIWSETARDLATYLNSFSRDLRRKASAA